MKHFIAITALLLAPLGALHSGDPAPISPRPVFRWNTVPVFAHCGKPDGPFTDEQAKALSRFAYVGLEKIQEMKFHKPAFETMRAAALAIKAHNPHVCVAAYWNTCLEDCAKLHGEGYEDFRKHRGAWQLPGKHGQPVLVRDAGMFDLTKPEVQAWWLDRVRKLAAEPAFDALFLDAATRAHWLISQCGPEQADAYDQAMRYLLGTLNRSTDKPLIYNGLNVRTAHWSDGGSRYLDCTDGLMVEHFLGYSQRDTDGSLRRDELVKTFQRVRDLSRTGKIILVRSWPKTHAVWGKRPGDQLWMNEPAVSVKSPSAKELPPQLTTPRAEKLREILRGELEFCLACFLICAGENCYFNYSWGYGEWAWGSSGNFDWYPEFDRPLGPPKGEFKQDGMIFTREFAHAAVRVDLEKEQAHIDWRQP